MSSTATQVETEQLASAESNIPMEDAGEVQIPIVGRSPRSIAYLDPKETLLVIDVVHKHLPPCPGITIPVLRLPTPTPPALKFQPRGATSTPMRQVNFDDQLAVAPLDDSIPLIADDVPADEQAADQQDFL